MPVLTVVIGAPGSGKSLWCGDNGHFLPRPFYIADAHDTSSVDFNDPSCQASARAALDASIEQRIERGEDSGFSTNYSDTSLPALVRRTSALGYSVSGVYLGTSSPRVNFRRLATRRSAPNGLPVPYEEAERS